jgi:fumarate reductase subunit D
MGMMFSTLKLVYKNMIWGRPMIGLWGLIIVALLSTANLYYGLNKLDHAMAIVFGFISLSLWFFGLPCILTLIDMKMSPKRIEKVWELIHK